MGSGKILKQRDQRNQRHKELYFWVTEPVETAVTGCGDFQSL